MQINTIDSTMPLNTIILKDGQPEIVPIGVYNEITYDDDRTGSPKAQGFTTDKRWGAADYKLSLAAGSTKNGNAQRPVDHATVLEPLLDTGWEIAKATHLSSGMRADYVLKQPDAVNFRSVSAHWSDALWEKAVAAHRGESRIEHVINVHCTVDVSQSIVLEEGFMYTWCTNGAKRLAVLHRAIFKHGDWKAIGMLEAVEKLTVPRLTSEEVLELPMMLCGKPLGRTNDGVLQEVSRHVSLLRESKKKDGPEFHWEDLTPLGDKATRILESQAMWYLEDLSRQLSKAHNLIGAGVPLFQETGQTIATNTVNYFVASNPANERDIFNQSRRATENVGDAINALIEIWE